MSRYAPGDLVRVCNPVSVFHGRQATVVAYIWPDMPNPLLKVRLLPDSGRPMLPCCEDEIEPWTLEESRR
jgi:hypothetical protein